MTENPLAEVLRGLAPHASVELSLDEVPVDELLLSVYETRFSGSIEIGREPERDVLQVRGGKVVEVTPGRYVHVALLSKVLIEMGLVGGDALWHLLEQDPSMDGVTLGRRLVEGGALAKDDLLRAQAESGRRRLFFLYDHHHARAQIRQGLPGSLDVGPYVIDVLPAVAYGAVMLASPTRRRLMLARARGQHARLLVPYDSGRNRYGLPPALLPAVEALSNDGVTLGPEPSIGGLSGEVTAGLLLLFHRLNLLAFGPRPAVPEPVASTIPVAGRGKLA